MAEGVIFFRLEAMDIQGSLGSHEVTKRRPCRWTQSVRLDGAYTANQNCRILLLMITRARYCSPLVCVWLLILEAVEEKPPCCYPLGPGSATYPSSLAAARSESAG